MSRKMKRIVSGWLVFAVYWSMFLPFAIRTNAQAVSTARKSMLVDIPQGLTFRLSEGIEGAGSREKQQLAPADPLSADRSADLLKRLPAIKVEPDDTKDFAKRIGTLPAPKTGTQIPVKFPSDE